VRSAGGGGARVRGVRGGGAGAAAAAAPRPRRTRAARGFAGRGVEWTRGGGGRVGQLSTGFGVHRVTGRHGDCVERGRGDKTVFGGKDGSNTLKDSRAPELHRQI
jgi:hypothetical protein